MKKVANASVSVRECLFASVAEYNRKYGTTKAGFHLGFLGIFKTLMFSLSIVHSLSSRPGASPKHPVGCFTTFFAVLMNFSICFGQQRKVIRGSIQAGLYMFDLFQLL